MNSKAPDMKPSNPRARSVRIAIPVTRVLMLAAMMMMVDLAQAASLVTERD